MRLTARASAAQASRSKGPETAPDAEIRGPSAITSGTTAKPAGDAAGPALKSPTPSRSRTPSTARRLATTPAASDTSSAYSSNEFVLMRVVWTSKPAAVNAAAAARLKAAADTICASHSPDARPPLRRVIPVVIVRTLSNGALPKAADMTSHRRDAPKPRPAPNLAGDPIVLRRGATRRGEATAREAILRQLEL